MASFVLEKSCQASVSTVLRSNFSAVSRDGYDIDSVDHGRIKNWKPSRGSLRLEFLLPMSILIHYAVFPSFDAAVPRTQDEQYDYIVIAVKSLPSTASSIVHGIKPLVSTGTVIVLIQNGLDIEQPFSEQFPATPLLSGVSLIGSRLTGQNSVYHEGPDILKIGAYFHHEASLPHAVQLKAAKEFTALYGAGLRNSLNSYAKCSLVPDIAAARWQKLMVNSTLNVICTLLRISVGELLSSPHGRDKLLEPAIREVSAIGTAAGYGYALDETAIQDTLNWMSKSSSFRPSMLVDLEAGRPLELSAILGAPLRVASKHGVQAPLLCRLYDLLSVTQWMLEVGKST